MCNESPKKSEEVNQDQPKPLKLIIASLPRWKKSAQEPSKTVRGIDRGAMIESSSMGRYQKGDHIKIEVGDNASESEWMWLLVEYSDDERAVVFGTLDSQPVAVTDMKLGQHLAVSYEQIRDHRKFN